MNQDELDISLSNEYVNLDESRRLKCAEWQVDPANFGCHVNFSSSGLSFRTRFETILVHDLFTGKHKQLIPTNLKSQICYFKFKFLFNNYGLAFYSVEDETLMSLTSLDLNANTYTFIGNAYKIPNTNEKYRLPEIDDVSYLSDQLISVKVKQETTPVIYLYKLNQNPMKLDFWKNNFHVARVSDNEYTTYYSIQGLALLDENGSVTHLENTGTRFQATSNGGIFKDTNSFQHCWHGDRLFCLINFRCANNPIQATQSFSMFDLKTMNWIQILNTLSLNTSVAFFNVHNGILNYLHQRNNFDESNRQWLSSDLAYYRYPIGENWSKRNASILCGQYFYTLEDNAIYAYSLFFGTLKRFVPNNPKCKVVGRYLIHLTRTYGIMVHYVGNKTFITLICFDYSNKTYSFVGESLHIPNETQKYLDVDDISRLSDDTFSVKVKGKWNYFIHLYKLNEKPFKLCFQKSIEVPNDSRWYKSIDKQIYCVRTDKRVTGQCVDASTKCDLRFFIHGVYILDEYTGATMELKDTGICFQSFSLEGWFNTTAKNFKCYWTDDRLFCSPVFMPIRHTAPEMHFIYMFEVMPRKWTNIQLHPLSIREETDVMFDVKDGILICFYQKTRRDKRFKWTGDDVALYRYPIQCPETLCRLAWLNARELGLESVIIKMFN